MYRSIGSTRRTRILVGLAAALMCGLPALAETTVERGDILYVNVVGTPEMERNARVDADGRIQLPLVGGIEVAGVELDAIRDRIEQVLIARNILLDPVVLVEVSTYRPIYIGGVVKRSGAVPFEPGLTVRHALIAAGGVETSVRGDRIDIGGILELLARQRVTALSLAQVNSQIARLQAQLAGSDLPPGKATGAAPDAKDIKAVDRALLNDLHGQRDANEAYAATALELVDVEIDVLKQQATHQQTEQQIQLDEIERTRKLVERGLAPLPKLKELQRENSRLSRDLLENYAYAARAEQSRENIRHQTQSEQTELRISAREAHRAALRERTALQAEMEAISGHLLAAGSAPTPKGPTAWTDHNVVIFRKSGGVTTQITATMETGLEPGDIVELRMPDLPRG